MLKTHLSRIDKDDRYRYEVIKRMITVKAKKQTELEMKRRNRSGAETKKSAVPKETTEIMSIDSRSPSPEDPVPLSPKSSPTSAYAYDYRASEGPHLPRPYQHGRSLPSRMSPQSTKSNPAEISDIFLAQTQRMIPFLPS
jgi:hypothetical protein